MVERLITTLNERSLVKAAGELGARDSDLARILRAHGPPPLWAREPGFGTMVLLILEQQVSLASARAAYDRLEERLVRVTPKRLLELDEGEMRASGFSRQKTRYTRLLAKAFLTGEFRPEELTHATDEEAREKLVALTGIGPWTADIYLLMVLLRPDVWPRGDRALVVAAREIRRLDEDPSEDELARIAERWSPWRSVAARLLWHYYLSTPRVRTRSL